MKTILPWSDPKKVTTRAGDRMLSTAEPTQEFWQLWRDNKEALKAAGISLGKKGEAWQACWWQSLDPAQDAAKLAALKAKQETERVELERALAGIDAALPPELEARMLAIAPKCLAYQVPSVRRQVKALLDYNRAVDASDTGTGKTYVNLATCAVLGRPVFVVCPKAVRPSWRRAAEHYGVKLVGVENHEILRGGRTTWVKIVKEGKAEKFIWSLPTDTVFIFDEIHRLKDFKTLNCKMGLAAISQGYTVLGLSATAADNPMHMKFSGLLAGLFADERDFFKWMMRNGVTRGRFGMEFNGGRETLAKIHKQIFPLHGTRIRIADLGDQFPETQISAESYDLNGTANDIQRAYDEMAAEIARIEASSAEDKGACILTEILRARQRAEVLKVPAIADMATDQMDEGMSVAIFCNFDDTIDALCAKLGTRCVIRGGQSDADRQANIDAFNADREHVIICNIKAGGVGVSLHGTKTSRMRFAIICPTHSGQDLKQALGRVWRANGAKSIQRIFFAAGTIEEAVCKGVNAKISRIDILNDGIPDDDLAIGAERNFKLEAEERLALRSLETPEPSGSTATTVTVSQASAKVVAKRAEIDALAAKLTPAQCRLAHQAMQRLDACNADGAREVNGVGFSKSDSEFGRKLAQAASLSNRQAAYAVRLAVKYRKQLGDLFPEFYAQTTD